MCAYSLSVQSLRSKEFAEPCEELRVAVTFPRPDGGPGPTKSHTRLTLKNVKEFVPTKQMMDQGIDELSKLGFKLTGRGRLTVSMKCTQETFKNAFKTKLEKKRLPTREGQAFGSFGYPPRGAPWTPILEGLIDDVYIQWPHLFPPRRAAQTQSSEDEFIQRPLKYKTPSDKPPEVNYYHLQVPNRLASLLKAAEVHHKGTKGKGIRVVMIDSGFEHSHPFFHKYEYTSKVVLAGDAKNKKKDDFGHGTGQSVNIFSIAPDVEFIGVKIGTDTSNNILNTTPASTLEGFYKARRENPDIISISGGADLRFETSKRPRSNLPNSLKALEAEILHAVASGITVVGAAGNGQFSFPAMMPDVISAGGVFVAKDGSMCASNFASAYDSKIYSGRHVPDICGLVGMQPKLHRKDLKLSPGERPFDHYILFPVPPFSFIDLHQLYDSDGTSPGDGWAGFSGTSAAAPQIAGVCALLKAKKPNLTPSEIKTILQDTAVEVLKGKSNPESSDDGKAPQKGAGATGAGLVHAYRAWQAVEES